MTARSRLRAVLANLGWLLASNALMAVLSLVYIGMATRTLGLADFGRFALITGTAQTLAMLVSFETWKVVVQYGLDHEAAGDNAATWRLEQAAALIEVCSAGLGIALVIVLFSLWPAPFGMDAAVVPYAIGYAVVQLITLRSTPTGILRMRDRFRLAALADSVQPIGRLVGATLAQWLWPELAGFLLAWAIAELLTLAATWALAAQTGDVRGLLRVRHGWRQARAENPGIGRVLISTNGQSTLGLAARQAPLLLVGGFVGAEAAGAFRLAAQLANALSKISILLTRAAFPEIVRSIRTASRAHFRAGVLRVGLAGLLAAGAVMALVALAGRNLLMAVGGHAFGAGYVYLLWLAGAGAIELAAAAFEPILLSVHRALSATVARAAAVALQLGLMLVLLPQIGALGASISVFAGSVAASVLLGAVLWHYAMHHGLDEAAA
ncbi:MULTISPECIES: lipopolysaccharide biosynthesis protein [unclassified Novosphingobium]|uniref:lipopolysaccharide biosynthesis protein n=1 Tax=unclassified Novosphingobium TaxID=2644732 RepID=UPI0006B9D989|nr:MULTISPECIES: lipopolysaccharide biosynthesis protein [unclassified Novosphingobium]KPF55705.1 hypothetical protein IP65_06590 [Novosphingobium sp. AAP1]PTR11958.1 O-antigen/teichoic acid export membrane protein [Novosphingobium sp. GV055]PUB04998.1 O-antigen/teichoic acid export membrane protein [Novosphingobium sp. GV061]PUB21317.1 O-antigen/teichoic acid export membrane protein [Novosphingobium sp. GV079]PUB43043.1 O-antigen/teichoic acid export membrane protein [Novosphingobium sp. GV02